MKVLISEADERSLINSILAEAFSPSSEKVLIVKDYLDKNFTKDSMDDIDENGYPKKITTAVMMSGDGQPLKTVLPKELLLLLDDKFSKIISDDSDRKKFLKQVITDWFSGNISSSGILSVNWLK